MMVSNGRGIMACIGRGRPSVVRASNPLFARAPVCHRQWEHRRGRPSQHPSHAGTRRFGIHLASGIAENGGAIAAACGWPSCHFDDQCQAALNQREFGAAL
ncbi:hypothetical protein [Ralstonia pseudosolanacearum]